MSVKDQIRPVVEPPLAALGLLVEDVAVTPAGKRRMVRIWIDRVVPDDGDSTTSTPPLSLDEVADATRVVSDALDEADTMGEQPYTLEVTSPGLDRPLTEPRHFRRNVGRLVTITPTEGDKVTGRIVRAGADGVTLEVPAAKKTPARTVELPYAAISRAVVEVEFSRPDSGADDGADDTSGDDTTGGAAATEEE
ncbi:ribosome maturation factor RimP [Knoellia koreensis]|uniref:Ribosome maturation factor RimP n=1 Tax=Knoellia koreensis TaxID=2730921 RepID=A0A849HFQ4_9MICO|nr:ribosome maturation factor RimP [Knoellia sp. DB2414S]NNM45483.1 ribosome maturation factor RimP [Knoellia sp. DB2414S]